MDSGSMHRHADSVGHVYEVQRRMSLDEPIRRVGER